MVDLHDSLRPSGITDPLPVSELASRATRRRRRRLAAVGGSAAVVLAAVTLAIVNLPSGRLQNPTVADRGPEVVDSLGSNEPDSLSDTPDVLSETPDPTVDSTSSTETTIGATSSVPVVGADTTQGLATSISTTSAWEDGYCIQVDVDNDTADGSAWQVVLELGGTINTTWNADAVASDRPGVFVFTGLADFNVDLAPGSMTSFGTCVDT